MVIGVEAWQWDTRFLNSYSYTATLKYRKNWTSFEVQHFHNFVNDVRKTLNYVTVISRNIFLLTIKILKMITNYNI